MSNPSVCSILDMPDEILVMIILHFNARERLALGNSCQRFNDLVFGDKELLRNLDFSGKQEFTKESDIQQYFNDQNTYKKIFRINTNRVKVVRNLKSSIGKAINLVELIIVGGLEFKSVEELSRFLKPLVHLKRLSVNWPNPCEGASYANPKWHKVLKKPLGRLTYLSLEIEKYSDDFLLILQLCIQLKELHMSILSYKYGIEIPMPQEYVKLSNLKSVRAHDKDAMIEPLRDVLMSIVPDPDEWTDFYIVDLEREIYLEKNVEVCAELGQVKVMPLPQYIAASRDPGLIDTSWSLVPEHLLSQVIRVTHENVPEKFCCCSSSTCEYECPCLLKIDDAKKLLKDPRHQITDLRISHVIEKTCDAHLLASAFPNLTKLVLSGMSNRNSMLVPEKTKPLHRCLRRQGSLESKEDSDATNTDSSFKILVENTPHLKVLKIPAEESETIDVEDWDLDALYLISGWKNLTVIRLFSIPITDGKFLIEIGRKCEKLEKVTLRHLGPTKYCNYESELVQMLQHCKNLRKLKIQQSRLEHLSEMFDVLSNCPRLRALCLQTCTKRCDSLELTSSVEKMLHQCEELNKFSIDIQPGQTCNKLRLAVKRIISKLNRSGFQFESN